MSIYRKPAIIPIVFLTAIGIGYSSLSMAHFDSKNTYTQSSQSTEPAVQKKIKTATTNVTKIKILFCHIELKRT
jgi:hypothetical protein